MSSSDPSYVSTVSNVKWPPSAALEWTLVELLKPALKHGGTSELKCKYCGKEMKISSVTRLREHYVNEKLKAICPKVPRDIMEELQSQLLGSLSS